MTWYNTFKLQTKMSQRDGKRTLYILNCVKKRNNLEKINWYLFFITGPKDESPSGPGVSPNYMTYITL